MASATQHNPACMAVIDSGLGGLSVVRALRVRQPDLPIVYAADTGAFPYGGRSAEEVIARGIALVSALQQVHRFAQVVVACNTLSTLALAQLRQQFPSLAFVGTVPAIKVAASQSATRRFTLLATPNTAHSSYSRELIARFAADCVVDCYGAPNLARYAEMQLLGQPVSAVQWREEIAPCFHDDARGRTDQVILGCTHYPLVLEQLRAHAPWPVAWIDAGDAIARHALQTTPPEHGGASHAYVTDEASVAVYRPLFLREALGETALLTPDADLAPAAATA